MLFKIGDKEYELKFGLKCIRELDKVYTVDQQGVEFGMGINLAYANLLNYNPTALPEIIRAALSHLSSPPRLKDIEEAIEQYAVENDGLEQLFEEFLDELGKSPVAKATIKRIEQLGKAANVQS